MKGKRFSLAVDLGVKSCAAFCLGLSSALLIFSLLCKEEEKLIKVLTVFAVCFAFVVSVFFLLFAINGLDAESKDELLKDKSSQLFGVAHELKRASDENLDLLTQLLISECEGVLQFLIINLQKMQDAQGLAKKYQDTIAKMRSVRQDCDHSKENSLQLLESLDKLFDAYSASKTTTDDVTITKAVDNSAKVST